MKKLKNEVTEIWSDLSDIYILFVLKKTKLIGYVRNKIELPYRYIPSVLWKTAVKGW